MTPLSRVDLHRAVPHATEAERGLAGSAALNPEAIFESPACNVPTEAFFDPLARAAWDSLRRSYRAGLPCDLISITQEMRQTKMLDATGGPAGITSIFTFVPTVANAPHYAQIVRDKAALRRCITLFTGLVEAAYNESDEPSELISRAEAEVLAVGEAHSAARATHFVDLGEVMRRVTDNIERIYTLKGAPDGAPSGFKDYDAMIGGLHTQEYIVLAARPAMGKTALVMNMVEHLMIENNRHVAVFSLEMGATALVQRMLLSRARVNSRRLRDGFLTEAQFRDITREQNRIVNERFHLDEGSALDIEEIRSRARRLKHACPDLTLVAVDYIGLMRSGTEQGRGNREREISEISAGLAAMKKELDVTVVALCQLNRKVEGRSGHRPMLSDLRESGSIEQDADIVAFLHRAEYYATEEDERRELAGKATLDIAKNRNGEIGEIELHFDKGLVRFSDAR